LQLLLSFKRVEAGYKNNNNNNNNNKKKKKKKPGGIHPIAIGFTLRRLASKCANSFGTGQLKPLSTPHQLGVGIPGGCEAAIHSGRRYLEAMPDDHVLVKLDFSNAFNSLQRHDMLLTVLNRVPELYAYCCSAYSHPSTLFLAPTRFHLRKGLNKVTTRPSLLQHNSATAVFWLQN